MAKIFSISNCAKGLNPGRTLFPQAFFAIIEKYFSSIPISEKLRFNPNVSKYVQFGINVFGIDANLPEMEICLITSSL
ncbi:MAG: hypothetical protein NC247_07710 [Ruminococcus flavefaciens]|nr:hypothetical protein [Ruminococcus flavefaciens]MCM1362755.1 hypothetical protein [Clostridiales bacterium]